MNVTATTLDTLFQLERAVTALLHLAVKSVSLYVYVFGLIKATATTLDTLFQLERAVTALLRLAVRSVSLYVYISPLICATAICNFQVQEKPLEMKFRSSKHIISSLFYYFLSPYLASVLCDFDHQNCRLIIPFFTIGRLARKEEVASTVVQSLRILLAMKPGSIFHVSKQASDRQEVMGVSW
jgi:hypothetical protein